jgi:hypothetical protein
MPTESGRPHDVARCPARGTAIWSHYGGARTLSFVRAGTLDTPGALHPDAHIYTRSKLPWVQLPDGVPTFDPYYDAKTLWPAASLARPEVLFG